ncbi:hypothetical protein NQZ68_001342, partial [Dissostichus eleginoides]
MKVFAFLRETKIACKVKKNLRGPPNNSLLQRPDDGRWVSAAFRFNNLSSDIGEALKTCRAFKCFGSE